MGQGQLLPKSGVGVQAPWLVMAPPNNPVIRVDLRLLDDITLAKLRSEVVLVCGELEVGLRIADGRAACRRTLVAALAWTRAGGGPARPLPRSGEPDGIKAPEQPDVEHFVIVDRDPVRKRGEYLEVGSVAFLISEVREYARRGANLPLPGDRLLQAALAMCVVARSEAISAGAPARP